jgi:hypothetical protein
MNGGGSSGRGIPGAGWDVGDVGDGREAKVRRRFQSDLCNGLSEGETTQTCSISFFR